MIILGIDPGSRVTGYGIIESRGPSDFFYLASGCIVTEGEDMAPRLHTIYSGLCEVVEAYEPDEAAIEEVFVHQNVNSALKLGQARGAAIVAVGPVRPLSEYSTRQVKQSVVGYGAADKPQIQHMVRTLLHLSDLPEEDSADALAIALCHAQIRASGLNGLAATKPRGLYRRRWRAA
jgi:crossover junction endodeoxyribonuclease RuvC